MFMFVIDLNLEFCFASQEHDLMTLASFLLIEKP